MIEETWGFRTRCRARRRRARPDNGRPGGAHLPDDELRVRGHRRRRRPVRAAEVRQHLQPHRATPPWPRSRSGWPASRAASARSPRPAGSRPSSSRSPRWPAPATTSWRPRSSTAARCTLLDVHAAPLRRRHHVRRRRRPRRLRRRDHAEHEGWSTPRSSPTRRARSPTSTALADVAHAAGIPLVVDATWPRRTCAGRSSTAPTSWCTRPPSSSAATARRSAAWSSSRAASTGATAASRR